MSHPANDNFRETMRENRVEQIYNSIIPDRCYTVYRADDKEEVKWRLQNCFPERKPVQERSYFTKQLPPITDEDYWRERQAEAERLREVYAEAQLYRDI